MTGGYSHTYRVAVPVAHRGLKPEGEVVANPELKLGVSPMAEFHPELKLGVSRMSELLITPS